LKFTREISSVATIRRVSADAIVIGNDRYTGTIALTPEGPVADFDPPPVGELSIAHFETLLEDELELLILGTGNRAVFPPRELTFAFARRRIGFEVMDTAAAARTFNVLAGEGRRLAAVLYL
jgi:uncharacterized protein